MAAPPTGCCWNVGAWVGDDEMTITSNVIQEVSGTPAGAYALPKVTGFKLSPVIETPTRYRHSDSGGIKVYLCTPQVVTYETTVSYAQCDDPQLIDFWVRQGKTYMFVLAPQQHANHGNSAAANTALGLSPPVEMAQADFDETPHFCAKGRANTGERNYDGNEISGNISSFTIDSTVAISEPAYATPVEAPATTIHS